MPNWKHLPVGYHGRAGTVVVSGTAGDPPERPAPGPGRRPGVRPVACGWTSRPRSASSSARAAPGPLSVADFTYHVFGVFLVNDWSARDIQAWESRPLGPFLAKSFATSISPWVVPLDALEQARISPPPQDPPPLPYLAGTGSWGLDLALEVG